MDEEQILIAYVGQAVLALVASGLLVRRRVAFCWSFFLYINATLVSEFLIVTWPDRFYDYAFYSAKESALTVLKIAVALEMWQRTFASFPRARVRVGFLLAGVLLATAIGVLQVSRDVPSYYALMSLVSPRQKAGTIGVFAIVVVGAWWHRIPLHPLYRAILLGFAGYLNVSRTFVTQSRIASLIASFNVRLPDDTLRTSAPINFIRKTLGC
jgi:hypothetical protein